MASGIFAILDDIAALMDDVAVASKIATKKTAGILGDDLAVNAEKATGFLSSREIPVLWAITKGSFINKLIIVPIALLLNFFFPIAIKVILILGGCYLAYEGAEKIIHYIFHKSNGNDKITSESTMNDEQLEKAKIKSAITTDFILSVEIVIIALGTVLEQKLSLPIQIITVSVVAFIATVGVYGIVALIVRMDDAGYQLIKKTNNKGFMAKVGHFLVKALPHVIRILAFVGTIALLLVSGGIFSHNIDFFHDLFSNMNTTLKEFLLGLIIGFIVLIIITSMKKALKLISNK